MDLGQDQFKLESLSVDLPCCCPSPTDLEHHSDDTAYLLFRLAHLSPLLPLSEPPPTPPNPIASLHSPP